MKSAEFAGICRKPCRHCHDAHLFNQVTCVMLFMASPSEVHKHLKTPSRLHPHHSASLGGRICPGRQSRRGSTWNLFYVLGCVWCRLVVCLSVLVCSCSVPRELLFKAACITPYFGEAPSVKRKKTATILTPREFKRMIARAALSTNNSGVSGAMIS